MEYERNNLGKVYSGGEVDEYGFPANGIVYLHRLLSSFCCGGGGGGSPRIYGEVTSSIERGPDNLEFYHWFPDDPSVITIGISIRSLLPDL
jgi:hypothetical protein